MVTAGAGAIVDERYEILGVLGAGGFGTVYKARQIHLDRIVALKVLNEASDEQAWARFEREAKILSSLQNKHITFFHSFSHWAGAPYMVTEFVEGQDLQKVLFANKPLGVPRSLAIVMQICDGVGAAHTAGVIHRDLKPSNVLLSADDSVKVIDFGLAKLIAGSAGQKLTEAGCAIGSVLYMSPEQCIGQPADERSDIYALGAILHHCLTGRPIFDGDHSVVVMQKHVSEAPPRITESDVGGARVADLQAVLDKCLAKNPDDRYKSVPDLLADLQLIESHQSPTASVEPVPMRVHGNAASSPPTAKLAKYALPAIATAFILIATAAVCIHFASSDARFLARMANFCESHNQSGIAESLRTHIFGDLTEPSTPAWVDAGIALIRTQKATGNTADAEAVFNRIEQYLLQTSKRDVSTAEQLIRLRQSYRPERDPSISEAMFGYANLLADSNRDSEAKDAFEQYLASAKSSLRRNIRDEIVARCRLIILNRRNAGGESAMLFDQVISDCMKVSDLTEDDLDYVESALMFAPEKKALTYSVEKWISVGPVVLERCHIPAKARTRYEIQTRAFWAHLSVKERAWKQAEVQLSKTCQMCEDSRIFSAGQHLNLRQLIQNALNSYFRAAPDRQGTDRLIQRFVNSKDSAMQQCGYSAMSVLPKSP